MLRIAIKSLANLTVPSDLKVQFLVVDNFPSKEVEDVFKEETQHLAFSSHYLAEENRGIVYARNKALSFASTSGMDYIAFFDDDDQVEKDWLANLWQCLNKYSADVVAGAVTYSWPTGCSLDESVKRIYDNPFGHLKTGDLRIKSSTCNTLFDFRFAEKYHLKFHLKLNLTGGEDSHFFEKMHLLGAKIVWCKEATVYSEVEIARTTEEYIFKRKYNIGYVTYTIDKLLHGKVVAIWRNLTFGVDACINNFFEFLLKNPKSRTLRKERLIELKGRIHSMVGKQFENYNQTDGF